MEEVQKSKRKSRVPLVLAVIVLAVGAAIYFAPRLGIHGLMGVRKLGSEVPLVRLKIKVVDANGVAVEEVASKLTDASPDVTPTPQPQQQATATPQWYWGPTPTPTEAAERTASLKLAAFPFAFSAYVLDGSSILQWLEENPKASSFWKSELVQGMLIDIGRSLRIRAEDLKLQGAEGSFLLTLLRDVMNANFSIHYDIHRGKSGFVASFDSSKSSVASRILPVVTASLAKREYVVPNADVSIVEIVAGTQRLFLSEDGPKVYVGNGLQSLLSFIEQNVEGPLDSSGSLALTVRGEAFFDEMLPVIAGSKKWHSSANFVLGKDGASPGKLVLGPAKAFTYLKSEISDGVLAAAPPDVFAALLTSFYIPDNMESKDWAHIATAGLDYAPASDVRSGGIGLVWDMSYEEEQPLSDVGFIISRPTGKKSALNLEDFFGDDVSTATCAGGTILVAATSETLLSRMKDGCERQSPSLLGWEKRAEGSPAKQTSNFIVALSPAAPLGELFKSGVASAVASHSEDTGADPKWKSEYDAAVTRASESGTKTLSSLPAILYAGNLTGSGGTLNGFSLGNKK